MKLLDIVNNILSDMNSFPVSSIVEDVEAEQVANIVKNTYDYLVTIRKWPYTAKMIQLESSGDINKPTHMRMPVSVIQIKSIRYAVEEKNGNTRFQQVEYVHPEKFLQIVNQRSSHTNSYVDVIDNEVGEVFKITTNQPPRYATSFDDENIVFDSYDNSVDSAFERQDTLQSRKISVSAYVYPEFIISDNFVPEIPKTALQLLISESKSQCFLVLKQVDNPKEEMRARKLSAVLSRQSHRSGQKPARYPNYGRK